jgi:glyoxalase family protein
MSVILPGIHHVTAICGDPQRNLAFYTGTLGLRLVKQTVNFDDPGRYHLYYGDSTGTPGTLLTFFAWPGAPGGQRGLGQFTAFSLAVPTSSLGFWVERLVAYGVSHERPQKRFGEQVLAFKDPDGIPVEIVATPSATTKEGDQIGDIPPEHAIRSVHAVEL